MSWVTPFVIFVSFVVQSSRLLGVKSCVYLNAESAELFRPFRRAAEMGFVELRRSDLYILTSPQPLSEGEGSPILRESYL